jgi:putative flippase GtrA
MGASPRQLVKEIGAFGLVGGVAFLLDLGIFQLLYSHGVGAVTSKAVSTVVAMTAAYLGNRYWSFSHRSTTSVRREFLVFAVINGVTGLLNLAVVAFVRYALHQDSTVVLQAANVIGIGAGTIIRYGSYRKWVFTEPAAEPRTDIPEVEEKQPVGAGRPQAPEAA